MRYVRYVPANGTTDVNPLAGGTYLTISTPLNCSVEGDRRRRIAATAQGVISVAFSITCRGPGAIRVAATTSGTDIDPDGYLVGVPRGAKNVLPVNGDVLLTPIAAGDHGVLLSGFAANCRAAGTKLRTVRIIGEDTVSVAFAMICHPIGTVIDTIAFHTNRFSTPGAAWAIATVAADGTNIVRLTDNAVTDVDAAWSPDGSKVATACGPSFRPDICVVRVDGTGRINLTLGSSERYSVDEQPAWKPDGSTIVFRSNDGGSSGRLVLMSGNSNGIPDTYDASDPSWSPDGMKIAYTCRVEWDTRDICVTNERGMHIVNEVWDKTDVFGKLTSGSANYLAAWSPDGWLIAFTTERFGAPEIMTIDLQGTLTRLTPGRYASHPAWSPDGSRIAFVGRAGGTGASDIYIMNADGTGVTRITNDAYDDSSPTWKP